MQSFFNCCSGSADEQKSLCNVGGGKEVEDIVNADTKAADKDSKLVRPNGLRSPNPAGSLGSEDEKETAKHRLQRLIREFAQEVVGPGLGIEVLASELGDGGSLQEATLRMDRRLSQVEIWHQQGGPAPTLVIPLQQVDSIVKGFSQDSTDEAKSEALAVPRDNTSLTMVRKAKSEVRLIFDSTISRDRAYTCLRIFQMSVDQTSGSASPRSPAEGY
mmetsp:Transcript_80934/g.142777  ORF Transcript_80934/g.142777 Transcript_80934/m.142777 type:complete len:217 (+) Transcript_80934:124-774(+)